MAQENQLLFEFCNRIKKSRSPVIYIIIGIIAGVFVSISLFLFLSQPYSSDPTSVESKSNQDQELDQVLMTNSSAHDQAVSDQQEQTDPMSHDGFEQPKENELSNILSLLLIKRPNLTHNVFHLLMHS